MTEAFGKAIVKFSLFAGTFLAVIFIVFGACFVLFPVLSFKVLIMLFGALALFAGATFWSV